MATARPGYFWNGTEWAPIGVAPAGSNVTDHGQLTGRDNPEQHDIDSVTGLTAELAGKAPTAHSHPDETTVVAGSGIAVTQDATEWQVENTDPGTEAVQVHNTLDLAHAGMFTPADHPADPIAHDGVLASADHLHEGEYDPAGTATAEVAAHAGTGDAHPEYLIPGEVVAGPGIATEVTPEGSVLVTATSQGGVVPVLGHAANQGEATQTIPSQTWTKLIYGNVILGGLDATEEPSGGIRLGANAPAGWYDIFYVCGTSGVSGADSTNRRMRALVNGVVDDTLLPQINVEGITASAITTIFEGTGMRYLSPYDLIQIEVFQSTTGSLTTSGINTMLSITYRGPNAGVSASATPDPSSGAALFSYATLTTNPASTNNTFETVPLNSMPVTTLPATLMPNGDYRCDVDWLEGWYELEGVAVYSGNVTGTRGTRILVNGVTPSTGPGLLNVAPPPDSARPGGAFYQTKAYLKPGDLVSLQGRQQSGTALTFNGASYLSVEWLGSGVAPTVEEGINLLPSLPEEE